MTRFGKKSITLLVAGSLLTAASGLALRLTMISADKTGKALQELTRSEEEFGRVQQQLARWNKVQAGGGAVVPRVEPVALTADFSPEELPRINRVLAGMYADNGSLDLKSFVFEWSTTGQGGAGAATSGARVAHVSVLGNKVFLH